MVESSYLNARSQLRTFAYDCATGLLKSSTFSNNNGLKTSYNYDNYGRLVEQVEGANQSDGAGVKKRRTVTEYDDSERTVRVVSDRAAYNDQQIATVYHFNQLGSLFLRRDTDDTGGAVTAAGSGGIKTVTAELFESFSTTPTQTWNRYVLSSNPFRSSADSTMGWTLRSFDTEGRVQAVKFYRGAAKPTPTTAETPAAGFTGKIQYSYSGDTTTVTDPAAATRTSVIDSLGRLLSASDAGLSSASYIYDALDNLKSVNQSGQVRDFFYTSLGRLRQATNPESGTTSYEYYPGGALKKRTDARSATVDYAVDGLNRVTKKTYTGGAYPLPEATYCYDGKAYDAGSGNCVAASRTDYVRGALTAYGSRKTAPGNLLLPVSGGNPLQTTAVASTAVNAIDALGNPGSSTHLVAGLTAAQTVSYTYNVGGALTQLQYPSGKVVQYDVNGTNRTSAVRRGAGSTDYYATGVTYAATGAMAAATMGQKPTGPAAFTQSWSYNSRLQPRQMSAVNAASQSLLRLRLAYAPTYDSGFEETAATNNGNPRVEQVDYFAAPSTTKSITRTFDYDGANRIKKLDDGGNIQNLDYDAYGNVWQVGASTGIPELKQNGSSWYTTATNRLTGVQFDAAGNQEALTVNGPSALQMRYDAEGQMVRVENTSGAGSVLAEYDYDANGRRVVRKANNAVIQYLYGLGGQLLSEYGGAVSGSGTKYLVGDHLGSTRMVVDDAGGCVSRMDYAPFGAEIVRNTAVWPCYVSAAEVSQKFTGKERDAETGLDYFGARYMSAAQGRFTSPDLPLYAQRAGDPQSWNLYSYTRNNPLRYVDPDGRQDMPPQAECNGNQECIDSVNKTNAQFLTGVGKGVVNGAAATLDFLSCPICRPSEAPLPTEGFAEGAGNVVGSVIGSLGVGKALSLLGEFAFGSATAPTLNLGSGTNPMAGAINVDGNKALIGMGPNVIANAEQLPFRSGTFNQVHAINPRFEAATSEIARTMQSGGNLFVTGKPGNNFSFPSASSSFDQVLKGPAVRSSLFGTPRQSDGRALSMTGAITTIFRKR